jgi:hypothetical protein
VPPTTEPSPSDEMQELDAGSAAPDVAYGKKKASEADDVPPAAKKNTVIVAELAPPSPTWPTAQAGWHNMHSFNSILH